MPKRETRQGKDELRGPTGFIDQGRGGLPTRCFIVGKITSNINRKPLLPLIATSTHCISSDAVFYILAMRGAIAFRRRSRCDYSYYWYHKSIRFQRRTWVCIYIYRVTNYLRPSPSRTIAMTVIERPRDRIPNSSIKSVRQMLRHLENR